MVPHIDGIHHLKFPVLDIDQSLEWYARVLGARHLQSLDHYAEGARYAVEMQLPFVIIELRLDAEQALVQKKFDPLTFAVQGEKDLEVWAKWLDKQSVKHSRVLTGVVGWLLVFEDPNQRLLRLYTKDTHEKTETPDTDAYWL